MKYLYIPIILLLIGVEGFNTYNLHFKKQNATHVYVRTSEVFDAFILKQEMQKKYKSETQNASKFLDSLAFEIQVLASEVNESNPKDGKIKKLDLLKSKYYQKRSYYEEYAAKLTQNYDDQVLTQMKQYIKDYGTANHYEYVFGIMDDGLLLYGDEMLDVTEEVIEFINNKYQGDL